jgi:hypothetical protein
MIRIEFGYERWGGVAVAVGALVAAGPVSAQDVTYARDIAPILQENCQECHMEGSIAPIHLTNYDEARRYARRIRAKVADRVMPPWHIDKSVGIQHFKNDRSLSDDEIDAIVAWVDGGTPMGDEADLPPAPDFTDPLGFQLEDDFGAPDLVIESPAFTLDAETQDKWFRPVSPTGITEPRWVRAIEIRPVGPEAKQIMHHVLTYLSQDEEDSEYSVGPMITSARGGSMGGPGLFMEWAVGKEGEIFPVRRSAGNCTCTPSGRWSKTPRSSWACGSTTRTTFRKTVCAFGCSTPAVRPGSTFRRARSPSRSSTMC